MAPASDDRTAQDIPISGGRRAGKSARQEKPETAPDSSGTSGEQTAQEQAAPEESTPASNPQDSTAQDSTAQASNARQQAERADYQPKYDTPRRKPAEARANAFNPLAWLVEGATGFVEEARHGDLGLSEEFWKHFYAARRESLLTARALIDSLLEQTEKDAQQAQQKAERAQRRGEIRISE